MTLRLGPKRSGGARLVASAPVVEPLEISYQFHESPVHSQVP